MIEPSEQPVMSPIGQTGPHQYQFWDETTQLLALFEKSRESGDYANAAACFGRLARFRYEEVKRQPGYDPTKRSIVSIFQPKSAGTYLHNRLLQLGYCDFWWLFTHRLCASVCYTSAEAVEYYMRGGCTCHNHARPHPNILSALDRACVKKIWVHLRNPAETVVSSYHHYLGEGQGSGEIGEQRTQESLAEAPNQGIVPGSSKSDFVMMHIGWHTEWVASWLRFAHYHPGLVVFSYYKEMADPNALVRRVLKELNSDPPAYFRAEPAPNDRFRQKASADWRHGLTLEAQEYVERRVRDELGAFPAFEDLWALPPGSIVRAA